MMIIYLLKYDNTHTNTEEMVMGVFSTRELAQHAMRRLADEEADQEQEFVPGGTTTFTTQEKDDAITIIATTRGTLETEYASYYIESAMMDTILVT